LKTTFKAVKLKNRALPKIFTILLFIFFSGNLCGQNNIITGLVDQGIEQHDKGNYTAAIEKYKQALTLNTKDPHANYEIASSYFALKNYAYTIKHSNVVIAAGGLYADQAYILKGSAQDMQGNKTEAIKTYKEGIRKHGSNYLLYYNLALTSFNLKEYAECEGALMKALKINPSHASSHYLLGYTMNIKGQRSKSILALTNFLILEPTGTRAEAALALLEKQFATEKNNTVKKTEDDFATADFMISLLESSNKSESNKNLSAYSLFAGNLKSLFSVLGELKEKKKGFWWDFYVDFFYALSGEGHVDALSYYITESKKDQVILKWLDDNKDKYKAFSDWYSGFKR